MRVDLKTEGDEGYRSREAAPPLVDSNSTKIEFDNSQYRSSRITIASGQSMELVAPASPPFLLLALTDQLAVEGGGPRWQMLQTGDERFVHMSQRVMVRNVAAVPVPVLRVDLVTKPLK